MIALDTNLLVRLIVQDDEAQARAVERLFIKARRDQTPLFVSDVVLCELAWVLVRRLKINRADIADALDHILRTELVVVADAAAASRAVAAYRNGRGDFADYLIREHALLAEAGDVVTFDRTLKGESGFRVL
ncbi:MAG: PIN domain-containing protein [Gemmatimonadaceae bacterium]|nr:PIN domain-containing protein [Gemmatimonadaceae bacterium]